MLPLLEAKRANWYIFFSKYKYAHVIPCPLPHPLPNVYCTKQLFQSTPPSKLTLENFTISYQKSNFHLVSTNHTDSHWVCKSVIWLNDLYSSLIGLQSKMITLPVCKKSIRTYPVDRVASKDQSDFARRVIRTGHSPHFQSWTKEKGDLGIREQRTENKEHRQGSVAGQQRTCCFYIHKEWEANPQSTKPIPRAVSFPSLLDRRGLTHRSKETSKQKKGEETNSREKTPPLQNQSSWKVLMIYGSIYVVLKVRALEL